MKPRQQRMLAVGLAVVGLAVAAGLSFKAFEKNMMFFVDVSDVVAGEYPKNRNFRIGGLVVDGSVVREEGSLELAFQISDTRCAVDVRYSGVLPDLFREGQGVVAHGAMNADEIFIADKILAKHDEDYMAPEVAESIAKHAQDRMQSAQAKDAECDSQ